MSLNADAKTVLPSLIFDQTVMWSGFGARHFRIGAGEMPLHQHKSHMIILTLDDSSEAEIYTSDGMQLRGCPSPGNICIIPSGHSHRARFTGESEYLSLYLDPTLMTRATSNSSLKNSPEISEKYIERDPTINQIAHELLQEMKTDGASGQLYAESLANVLAVHLLRHYAEPGTNGDKFLTGGLTAYRLQCATEFINDNLAGELKLDDIAEAVGISPFHFAREFKRATGLAPHQYVLHHRVERVKKLLAESNLPIIEIGFRTGFNNQSHLTRVFRKLTAMTPKAYRDVAKS